MSKKEYLELLIKTHGLTPVDVAHYKTSSGVVGWSGTGINEDGTPIIYFYEPDGFNMAVYEILNQAANMQLRITYVTH